MRKENEGSWGRGVALVLWFCLLTTITYAQSRGKLPNLDGNTTSDGDKPVSLRAPERSKVSIFVLSNQGPMGELYYPASIDGKLGEDNFKAAETESDFKYPTVYFDISSTPIFGEGEEPDGRDLDLRWLDVEIKIEPECREPEDGEEKRCSLWLVDMYPNVSSSGKKDNPLVTGIGIAEQLAKLADPFFFSASGKSLNAKIGAGTNGLGVLFRNLLPPTIKTYFHPRITGGRTFGWTLRQDKTADQPSLLGLHRGLAFLQAGKHVTKIKVVSVVKSLWNKDVSADGKSANFSRRFTLALPVESVKEKPDPNEIKSMTHYPALIPIQDVCKIFSVKEGDCYKQETFNELRSVIKNGQASMEVCFPRNVTSDEGTRGVVFNRSALQALLGLDQSKPEK